MDRKLNFKIGQEVAVRIEDTSNAARHIKGKMNLDHIDEWCFTGIVKKVGKKYITVGFNDGSTEQFSVEDDYRQKYTSGGADYKLYLSKDDVIEEFKAEQLYSNIKSSFGGYHNDSKFTLDQLERINQIINENN